MLVCVIPGMGCMIVVVHAGIVDGEGNRAKTEKSAEGGNMWHRPHAVLWGRCKASSDCAASLWMLRAQLIQ